MHDRDKFSCQRVYDFSLVSCRGEVRNTSALVKWSAPYVPASNQSSEVLLLIHFSESFREGIGKLKYLYIPIS